MTPRTFSRARVTNVPVPCSVGTLFSDKVVSCQCPIFENRNDRRKGQQTAEMTDHRVCYHRKRNVFAGILVVNSPSRMLRN
jgi:hypothetical protein